MISEPRVAYSRCPVYSESTDEGRLVEAAKRGDEEAFTCLFRRHSTRTYQSLLRILRDREDARDALQETFFKAFVHLHSLEGKAKFSTWLIRIAANSALMELRRQPRRRTVQLGEYDDDYPFRCLEPIDHRVDIHRSLETAALKEVLAEAISRLKPVLREVIELQLRFNYSQHELAALANISVPAVKSRIFRAKKALRISLGRQLESAQKSRGDTSRYAIAQ